MLKIIDITARVNQLESNIGVEEPEEQDIEITEQNEKSQTLEDSRLQNESFYRM